uniref:Uncharacterized protein n=1 Tax=Romanomermis culicivorax TaxID=13658 RepID=A0A915IIW3_ROMCU
MRPTRRGNFVVACGQKFQIWRRRRSKLALRQQLQFTPTEKDFVHVVDVHFSIFSSKNSDAQFIGRKYVENWCGARVDHSQVVT